MSFKDRFKKSSPRHDKPPMDRPIIKTRMRPDLYKASWGDFTISNPGRPGASATTVTSTGSQTYTVPKGVDTITVTMYGGGGGGGLAASGRGGDIKGGGGGGGSRLVLTINEIRPGTVLTFNVGAGGDKSVGNGMSDDGGNTTLSYGGVDYVAGGGEGNRGGSISLGAPTKDGTGGAGDCDGGSTCTATAGNNGTAYNTGGSTTPGGAALGNSAGKGGDGSNNASSQNAEDGSDGKVIIS
jgi:hypothetical protein